MIFERLQCPVQHYAWGEKENNGQMALIPQLLGTEAGELPWAELWIGAHPKASSLLSDGRKLSDVLARDGERLLGNGANALPYLLKILCCSEPLSIQSHPDKKLAVKLHAQSPDQFPDENHKPEILVALSRFEMMAGFRPLKAIQQDLSSRLSLLSWQFGGGGYRDLCAALFGMPDTLVEKMQQDLLREVAGSMNAQDCLFRRLSEKYPGDCGCFFAYLLNFITLQPGEGVHIPANTPHAYLKGQGVECMACSDNVIRAGLTPKTIRKDILMDSLMFQESPVSSLKIASEPRDGRDFSFECDDFRLEIVSAGTQVFDDQAAELWLVLSGEVDFCGTGWTMTAPSGSAWFRPVNAGELKVIVPAGGRVVRVW